MYLRYLVKNETFHTFIMHCQNITHCIKHGVNIKFIKYRENKLTATRVCSNCPPLVWTQAHKHGGHWST